MNFHAPLLLHSIAIASICCMAAFPGKAENIVRSEEAPPALAPLASPSTETAVPEAKPKVVPKQRSYFGFGGAIGLQGSTTSLSDGAFSMVSKQVLTRNLAIHSADTIFGRSIASSSLALTYNHPIKSKNSPLVFIPFLGGGVMVYNENGLRVSPLVTGGIDIDTPANVTGTIRVNSGFVRGREADVGLILGVGYNY
jgi:hypothetical protein